jgi:hypothetical protein
VRPAGKFIAESVTMVFLAITPAGLAEALRLAAGTSPVWCGADALTESEFSAMQANNVTRFVHSLSGPGESAVIAEALVTIAEHHPGQRIWVEHEAGL